MPASSEPIHGRLRIGGTTGLTPEFHPLEPVLVPGVINAVEGTEAENALHHAEVP